MTLREVVEKYRALAGGFGRPVALAAFGLSREQTERDFAIFDEDYRISRYFHFTLETSAAARPAENFQINGFPQSHVSLDPQIESLL